MDQLTVQSLALIAVAAVLAPLLAELLRKLLPTGLAIGFLTLLVPASVVATRKVRATTSIVRAG